MPAVKKTSSPAYGFQHTVTGFQIVVGFQIRGPRQDQGLEQGLGFQNRVSISGYKTGFGISNQMTVGN